MGSVAVVVLGDVGRSPRMQYHCISLSNLPQTQVSLVGYEGERCVADVEDSPKITKYLISAPFAKAPRKLFLLWAPLKILFQILQLLWTLVFVIPRPRSFLVQNPPSIPALAVVWLAARMRGANFIIDWHNFGYTVLSLNLGPSHPLVPVATAYERFFAGRADGHLCVTNAMRLWLAKEWGVRATVLYDRAPPFFRPTTLFEQHDLFTRLADTLPSELSAWCAERSAQSPGKWAGAGHTEDADLDMPLPESLRRPEIVDASGMAGGSDRTSTPVRHRKQQQKSGGASIAVERTLFTEKLPSGQIVQRRDRPALLVSSTSWTEDEDFSILLGALEDLDAHAVAHANAFPDFLVLVTGKGPLRAHYEALIARLSLRRVVIRTLWLAPGDYPRLLGCADMGVSLHVSTSGLDLPMKVVDMFGAGTPVCAANFACLSELVRHDANGLIFNNRSQLAGQLESLFQGFPEEDPSHNLLARLRRGVADSQDVRWADNWTRCAAPLFIAKS